jgi:hypothetical protein
MMCRPLTYALYRTGSVLMSGMAVIGMLMILLLVGPSVELRWAYPVAIWEITDPRRVGDRLTWYVTVDKRRDCTPEVVWQAKWNRETRVLRAVTLDGDAVLNRSVVQAGEFAILGPLTSLVPKGWEQADAIRLDAIVSYKCGSPWPLPPLDVQSVVAK